MSYLENNSIKNEVIEELEEKLTEYEGTTSYGCDLAYTLFESYNIDGTITYSRYSAEIWIKNNWNNLGEILDELKFQFGNDYFTDIVMNIWDNPEKFMVIVCLEVSSYLLSQCSFVDKNWNDEVILTSDNIELISKQLEKLRVDNNEKVC